MEKGIDIEELFADQNTREESIVYKGKEWDFTIRDLTWKEKGDCITAATKIDIKGKKKGQKGGSSKIATLDMPAYNISYLMKTVVKAPFAVNMASFMKLDSEFGDTIVDAFVDPEGRDEDEEGNSEEQLEV